MKDGHKINYAKKMQQVRLCKWWAWKAKEKEVGDNDCEPNF